MAITAMGATESTTAFLSGPAGLYGTVGGGVDGVTLSSAVRRLIDLCPFVATDWGAEFLDPSAWGGEQMVISKKTADNLVNHFSAINPIGYPDEVYGALRLFLLGLRDAVKASRDAVLDWVRFYLTQASSTLFAV